MPRNPTKTRNKIMDAAQTLILDHGFGGTTVDAIIDVAEVSKGAFFHHFKSKNELGHVLVKRYAEADAEHLEKTLDKAEGLSNDPLQQLLIFVKLFEQEMEILDEPYPGCLLASYCYESELFDKEIMDIIRESMLNWRHRIFDKLQEVSEHHQPKMEVDFESLADMLIVLFEGAFVLSISLQDAKVIAQQLAQYHNYLRLLFGVEE